MCRIMVGEMVQNSQSLYSFTFNALIDIHEYIYSTVAQKGQTQISLLKHKTVSQNTNQFPKTQISLPKHKSISQNTNQFTKTQINFPKHKSVYQNTKQFLKTQTSFPKHKSISQNTNQFRETQIKRLGTCSVIIREPGRPTHSQDFPWRLLIFENVLPQLWI